MHTARTTRLARLMLLVSLSALGAVACAADRRDSAAEARTSSVMDSTVTSAAPVESTTTIAVPATTTTVAAPVHPTGTVDTLLPIGEGGARLHLHCTGSGPSTVVLIAGFGNGGDTWETVAPGLSAEARVCSYDRFGTGTSDAPPADQTFTSEADDLHQLLRTAGEVGPYVVVGHSFGGAEAVAFSSRFSDEVQGVLLLDASPVTWPGAVCAVPADGSETAAVFAGICAAISDPGKNPERLNAPVAFADVASIQSLGDVPMTVASRADLSYPGLPTTVDSQLAGVWTDGQAHWASLSSAAKLITVADTSHNIQIDQPAVVVAQISALLSEAKETT
jgi:pimeloyl-ACP methyl ester carboxylesterase